MNVKHPKFGCHVTSLCQGLRHSVGSGGEDPENQVVLAELQDIMQYMIKDNNPDVLWKDFKTKFLLVADVHAPQTMRKVKSEYTPWMTNNIKKQIYHQDFLKKKAIKTGSENMLVAYKKIKKCFE